MVMITFFGKNNKNNVEYFINLMTLVFDVKRKN